MSTKVRVVGCAMKKRSAKMNFITHSNDPCYCRSYGSWLVGTGLYVLADAVNDLGQLEHGELI